jgi:hypothetical protein
MLFLTGNACKNGFPFAGSKSKFKVTVISFAYHEHPHSIAEFYPVLKEVQINGKGEKNSCGSIFVFNINILLSTAIKKPA